MLTFMQSPYGISPFVLMTATFSQEMLQALAIELNAEAILLDTSDLAGIPAQKKTRTFHTVSQPLVAEEVVFIKKIVETHLAQNGRKIVETHLAQNGRQRSLVVCNQVERAQMVYQALRNHPQLTNVEIRLLHSRFLQTDRQVIEEEIRREFHKDSNLHTQESMIVVGTQVVEVGLDMSCRALHTELAPGTAVLQRAGRCARYQGEVGDVYVYFVEPEKRAPYNGKETKQQCELTWQWLQEHDGEHFNFSQEQALINHAHTPTDKRILDGLQGTEFSWRSQIYDLWQNDSPRGEASPLIRDIQAVSVVVHPDPEQLVHAPFKTESFSLHPGTLQGKFAQWEEDNGAKAEGFDDDCLDWLAQKLIEDESEADVQGNRPIKYAFKPIANKYELYAPLIAINPALVTYSKQLGLVLSPEKLGLDLAVEAPYQCDIPPFSEKQEYAQYGYQLESYETHIKLVQQAFTQNWQNWIDARGYSSWLEWVTAVGTRLEQNYKWQPGIVAEMAQLVVCLHDLGKLSTGWQGWAREWQAAVGHPLKAGETAAHTDYDPINEQHKTLNRKMGRKRPTHAVESALAALPFVSTLVPLNQLDKYNSLTRSAFTAIARHHAPFSTETKGYYLEKLASQEVQQTIQNLFPKQKRLLQQIEPLSSWDATDPSKLDTIKDSLLIRPNIALDVICYMLIVRALRFSDQKGTELGSSTI